VREAVAWRDVTVAADLINAVATADGVVAI
jgi:hypothetical protein